LERWAVRDDRREDQSDRQQETGRSLTEGNLDYARDLAVRQVAWGADVLDVNVGVPGLDEVGW